MSRRGEQKRAARVVREQLARERRRKRALWTSVIAIAALVIAGLIGWAVYSGQRSGGYNTPRGASEGATGIVVGNGKVTIDVYEDFLCPFCGQFERSSSGTLEQLVAEGKVKVVYHPISILDRYSTTKYSTRSSASSGCAADGGKYREYAKALFDRQPPEGSAGLSDDQLIDIGASVGLDRNSFGSCVREGTYRSWTAHVTDAASERGITGTPTILVNGESVQPNSEAITAAVQKAGG